MKINYAKEPNKAHKNNLKEDILQVFNENFIEMILDMVNQNVQVTLKKFQDNKNREFEKAQEQIKETVEAPYKHQTTKQQRTNNKHQTTKNTINKEINELRAKIDNIKEEGTQDVENLRKKNETEMQNKMEGQSIRLEQAEDRISELEDEMVIKGKTKELLVKPLKTCEKKM
jgi:flagellar biosynthesis GTPase FlhF